MTSKTPDLIIPVYLNQTFVFDLVAMLQGGIATVTRVTEAYRETDQVSSDVAGGFGLSQALSSLFKVDLGAKLSGTSEGATERSSAVERVHTPASLFFTLRNFLLDSGILLKYSPRLVVEPGQFIEFTATLQKNPLLDGLSTIRDIIDLFSLMAVESGKQGGGKRRNGGELDMKLIRKQVDSLINSIKAGGTQDLIASLASSDRRAILTVDEGHLRDPSLSDLVDGTFRVVGKVTRVVESPSQSISLLRKTALRRLPKGMIDSLKVVFEQLKTEHEFDFPTMETEIHGPVIQVLPIAIFS